MVDGILMEKGRVLLLKRHIYPYKGYWVTPGGHVEYGERVEDALRREMKEELGISVKIKRLLGTYSDPKRDPRYHTVSITFVIEGDTDKLSLNFEASEYKFFPLNKLPQKIGFDHRVMLRDLRSFLRVDRR